MLLVVVIGEWKSNLSDELILEPITINHLEFVVKILWKYYRCITSLSQINKFK